MKYELEETIEGLWEATPAHGSHPCLHYVGATRRTPDEAVNALRELVIDQLLAEVKRLDAILAREVAEPPT